jgi:hypothetical protein
MASHMRPGIISVRIGMNWKKKEKNANRIYQTGGLDTALTDQICSLPGTVRLRLVGGEPQHWLTCDWQVHIWLCLSNRYLSRWLTLPKDSQSHPDDGTWRPQMGLDYLIVSHLHSIKRLFAYMPLRGSVSRAKESHQ